jgi:hypothetical protein
VGLKGLMDRSCGDALRLMVERGNDVLPVIEESGDGELVGMLSLPSCSRTRSILWRTSSTR